MNKTILTACLTGIMLASLINLAPTINATEPPTADANGPYDYFECDTIFFDASQSSDPDGDVLQYRWDFENDGIWDTEWSYTPVAEHTWYDDYIGTLALEVTDGTYNDMDTTAVNIANANPLITEITGPTSPVDVGSQVPITANFTDGDPRSHLSYDTYTATFNWGDGTQSSIFLPNGTRQVTGVHVYSHAGTYTVYITIVDDNGGIGSGNYTFTVVGGPSSPGSGFVTGGGYIVVPAGSYHPDPSITGTANFGFNCKCKKGQSAPQGSLEFNFQEANLNFHSTGFDWLVVEGSQAQFQGSGRINGVQGYGFVVIVVDGKLNGLSGLWYMLKNGGLGHGDDTFQIQIWEKASGNTIFDTTVGIVLSGGQIVIHRA